MSQARNTLNDDPHVRPARPLEESWTWAVLLIAALEAVLRELQAWTDAPWWVPAAVAAVTFALVRLREKVTGKVRSFRRDPSAATDTDAGV